MGVLSSSDSSSSGSDSSGSDSGSDSDSDDQSAVQKRKSNFLSSIVPNLEKLIVPAPAPVFSNGAALLNEDLRLSDSNSSDDSDDD